MKSRTVFSAVLVLGLSACGNPDTPGGRAADARHENFEALGKAMKGIGDQLKAQNPDMAAIREAAGKIGAMAPQLATWFPAGSGPDDGLRTEARQTVWTKPEEFKLAASRFVEEAAKFNLAAQGNDIKAVGAAMQGLGGTCKGCHEKFKEED